MVMLAYDPGDRVVQENEVLATSSYLERWPSRFRVQTRPFPDRGHKFWASKEEGLAIVEFWSKALAWRPPSGAGKGDSTLVEIRPGTLQSMPSDA